MPTSFHHAPCNGSSVSCDWQKIWEEKRINFFFQQVIFCYCSWKWKSLNCPLSIWFHNLIQSHREYDTHVKLLSSQSISNALHTHHVSVIWTLDYLLLNERVFARLSIQIELTIKGVIHIQARQRSLQSKKRIYKILCIDLIPLITLKFYPTELPSSI